MFMGTLGVLISVAGFGVIRVVEELLEAVGVLPLRWGETNLTILLQLSVAVTIPIVLWFSVWFYRKALASERAMQHYRAPSQKV